MSIAIIFGIILALLFALAFVTKRRFGALGLALAAGSMLSELWAEALTPIVQEAGLVVQNPPMITVVSVALILLPAAVLLFSGPSYHDRSKRVIGAALFAVLAFALLIEPLGSALVLQGQGKDIYDFVAENRVYIVTVGLIIAVLDLLNAHTKRASKHPKH